ncbi:MAG: DEAD/DEAH box helicase, partial [Thermoguttaceae bacterium]|nr:DEAD/DEAH box helicase [Thermoguttaceae bacterium]
MFKQIENIQEALLRYIESAYHLSDNTILDKRTKLLRKNGIIVQSPYIESTAVYKQAARFSNLRIDKFIANGLEKLSKEEIVFNPPYQHQADALEAFLTDHKNIIVTTGTGSGKTECFLLPVLGRLLFEAQFPSFEQRAVRTLLLYPMNALVNDQLGRLRRLFASDGCMKLFNTVGHRPVKFGRYTGRTLFPGTVSLPQNDEEKKAFSDKMKKKYAGLEFFAKLADRALNSDDKMEKKIANDAIANLLQKGKFPAVYETPKKAAEGFLSWYGTSGSRWLQEGKLARTVERPYDPELLVRYEMQELPPDILVTNYSMLEYMLLRPIERDIFSKTKQFYQDHPEQRFFLVLDEAHLYNGAQGTEVAMLIRRLKHRLDLKPDQFQVICTSASFGEKETARTFAAQLSGVPEDSVVAITSDDKKIAHQPSGAGTQEVAKWLKGLDQQKLRQDQIKMQEVSQKLKSLAVFGRLANLTSLTKVEDDPVTMDNQEGPQEIDKLADKLFPHVEQNLAKAATDKLVEVASMIQNGDRPLFAARVHRFYRGLPGLWMCSNPNCHELFPTSQRHCNCGSRVFELHSCRKCGTAYFVAYTNDLQEPRYLWVDDCGKIDNVDGTVKKIHILLSEPFQGVKTTSKKSKKAVDPPPYRELYLNFHTGTLSDSPQGNNTTPVWVPATPKAKTSSDNGVNEALLFLQCPICNEKTTIRDHATKGDAPFQVMVTSQLLEQPELPEVNTPLKGRKTLIFSDGRQSASRLAGTLTTDSLRDAIRPLLIHGYSYLLERFKELQTQSFQFAYLAVLAGAYDKNITLSPILKQNELFDMVWKKIKKNLDNTNCTWLNIVKAFDGTKAVPETILQALYDTLFNAQSGLHALALARIVPCDGAVQEDEWKQLPVPKTVSDDKAEEWKRNLLDIWVQLMLGNRAVHLRGTPDTWIDNPEKDYPKRSNDLFISQITKIVGDKDFAKKGFSSEKNNTPKWFNWLRDTMGSCDRTTSNGFFLESGQLDYRAIGEETATNGWLRCRVCTQIYPYNPLVEHICPFCLSENKIEKLNMGENGKELAPNSAASKRTRVYRKATEQMWSTGEIPYPFIAKEHTAAIGALANSEDTFTRAEKYEIRFQDITLPDRDDNEAQIPVDVLSCTTTMEVGIDIGSLTAVAMRNVPPNRSNYQQRAGRAGRRGSSLSTILTYADHDSHNQRYFKEPAVMIGGPIMNPILNIDNEEIVRRHLFAMIFSMFQQERIQNMQDPNVFSTLGLVLDFCRGNETTFSYRGLESWLAQKRQEINRELKSVLAGNSAFTSEWIESIPAQLLAALKEKVVDPSGVNDNDNDNDDTTSESSVETDITPLNISKLLDLLFSKSLLPSYAFPTDTVGMYVFDKVRSENSTKPVLRYAPTYGLPQALTSYAPGKEVYIDGKRHFSFAIWSPFSNERYNNWDNRQLYYECNCGHVEMEPYTSGKEESKKDCSGCGGINTLGPARIWFIPPGFAQPCDISDELKQYDIPDWTFATHAKLTATFKG